MYDPTKPYKSQIKAAIERTWRSEYASAAQLPGLPYPLIMKNDLYQKCQEVDHTDGIGTKGVLHMRHRTFSAAVQDALAMNLNDLLVMRARPYKLQNHLTLNVDDHEAILAVVSSLSEECIKRKIILTGGETSIHNTMSGMDLSITITGFAWPVTNSFKTGDKLIGLPSSGIHSNGFTMARKYLGDDRIDLTTPTRIYWDNVSPWFRPYSKFLHGMVHIAGGAYSRILDMLSENQTARFDSLKNQQPIFDELYGHIKDDHTMYTVFNCGVGMILAVPAEEAENIAADLHAEVVGEIVEGPRKVVIRSAFSNEEIELQ